MAIGGADGAGGGGWKAFGGTNGGGWGNRFAAEGLAFGIAFNALLPELTCEATLRSVTFFELGFSVVVVVMGLFAFRLLVVLNGEPN